MRRIVFQVRVGPPNVIAIIVSSKLIVANVGPPNPFDNGGDEEEATVGAEGGKLPSWGDDGDETGMLLFAVVGCIVGANFGAIVGVIENST